MFCKQNVGVFRWHLAHCLESMLGEVKTSEVNCNKSALALRCRLIVYDR